MLAYARALCRQPLRKGALEKPEGWTTKQPLVQKSFGVGGKDPSVKQALSAKTGFILRLGN